MTLPEAAKRGADMARPPFNIIAVHDSEQCSSATWPLSAINHQNVVDSPRDNPPPPAPESRSPGYWPVLTLSGRF
jgi:hypothetical protein